MVDQFFLIQGPPVFSTRPLPKSIQLSELLIREIAAGRLPDGSRLPTEKQMAKDHGVAVGTLRKSLSILEGKGLLKRVQGSGNYIAAKDSVDSVYTLFRLELVKGGGLPSASILEIYLMPKPEGCPDFGDAKMAHRIVRLRYLDSHLIALEEIWLDQRFGSDIRLSDISESLYVYYKNALNLTISRIEDKIGVQSVPDWAPDTFDMAPGSSAGFIERIGWDQFDLPAEYSKTWFNPKVANYISRLS